MADDVIPAQATPPAAPSYPSDYEELKATKERYDALTAQLEPYVDDIAPILNDEDTREFLRSARKTYAEQLAARQPQADPVVDAVTDRIKGEFGDAVEYVRGLKKRDEESAAQTAAEAKRADDEAKAANLAYAQRLVAERPDLAEDEYAGIGMLAAYASNRSISLEEAWKRKGNSLGAPPRREKPPTSLRGDAAAPGVPGESTEPKAKGKVGLRQRLIANMKTGTRG